MPASPCTVVETDEAALDARPRRSRRALSRQRPRAARSAADEAQARIARIAGTTDLGAVADADIVIEAVFEDMAIKREVFATLDRIAKPGAVLATNTSYLDVDAIARGHVASRGAWSACTSSARRNVMRLLEVVRGAATSPETLAYRDRGRAQDRQGSGGGRRLPRLRRQPHATGARGTEAERLLLDGALPQEVDAAMTDFGFPMGPFAAADLAGLDIGWRMRKAQGLRAPVADALCEAGRFGQKTGRGFYRYDAGLAHGGARPRGRRADRGGAGAARRGRRPRSAGRRSSSG